LIIAVAIPQNILHTLYLPGLYANICIAGLKRSGVCVKSIRARMKSKCASVKSICSSMKSIHDGTKSIRDDAKSLHDGTKIL
jgi:hypothetical protein